MKNTNTAFTNKWRAGAATLALLLFSAPSVLKAASEGEQDDNVFFTMGVHNDYMCDQVDCEPDRQVGDPSDPKYPDYWISGWTMFRVTDNYRDNPPPYTNPPSTLGGQDYTVSFGTTYYDSTYVPADKDGKGAMMEHYEKYCLPIFPIEDNNYTCSFVSLGNKAYFLTYEEDRPADMPECCLFSPQNHPPEQDFIKHLPYSPWRSAQLNGSVQAYAIELDGGPAGSVLVGEATGKGKTSYNINLTRPNNPILFGYAFNQQASPDSNTGKWYRHPHSFYFSGDTTKANAPIVSQNYTSFRTQKPDPQNTWDMVGKMCTAQPLPDCQLFNYQQKQDAKRAMLKANARGQQQKQGAGVWSNLTPSASDSNDN